jgi:alpha-D-ribose 1-methylphosphonate 5-triphosphate synthase subunit PhnI
MYVAVKGGEQAIEQSLRLLGQSRRGDEAVPELSVTQIREQLSLAVDRVIKIPAMRAPGNCIRASCSQDSGPVSTT